MCYLVAFNTSERRPWKQHGFGSLFLVDFIFFSTERTDAEVISRQFLIG